MKPRLHFLAEQLQCGHHLLVRDQTAAIYLRQDAVDAELVLQRPQSFRNSSGRPTRTWPLNASS